MNLDDMTDEKLGLPFRTRWVGGGITGWFLVVELRAGVGGKRVLGKL